MPARKPMPGRPKPTARRPASKGSEAIGAVLASMLAQAKASQEPVRRIQRRWRELVGRGLATHTRPVSLRRGRLVVHVDGPGDGWALSYARAQVLEKLQRRLQLKVEEIVIRPGAADR